MTRPLPALRWTESSATAILSPQEFNLWYSGCANDVLHVGGNRLVVGSDTGGLWIAEPDGTAQPLSDDWDHPDVLCLAPGHGFPPNTFFCGTAGALFRSDWRAPDPPSTWRRLNLPDNVSKVRRIVTLEGGRIVIATDQGIWWAQLGDGDLVTWSQAQWKRAGGLTRPLGGDWNGLARTGPNQVIAGTFGPPLVEFEPFTRISHFQPLMWGEHSGDGLVFQRAALHMEGPGGLEDIPESDLQQMKFLSLASCDAQPNVAYAVTFHDTAGLIDGKPQPVLGSLFHVLRSFDGGHTWQKILPFLNPPAAAAPVRPVALGELAGDVTAGGLLKNISVHPASPNLVAMAALLGFVSQDWGESWTVVGGDWALDAKDTPQFIPATAHDHVDHHALVFAPELTSPDSPTPMFLASDGGVFRAGDWSDPGTFSSLHNRGLRTLQFYCPAPLRNFPGSLCSTPATRGIAAGGLQDNGDIWKPDNTRGTWKPSEGGDGGFNVALSADRYFHQELSQSTGGTDGGVLVNAVLDAGDALDAPAQQVPVRDPSGAQVQPFLRTPVEPVNVPTFRDDQNRLLLALGWSNGTLYGLFGDDDASNPFWRALVSFPSGVLAKDEGIVWAASDDGMEILLATSQGKIYRYGTGSEQPQPMLAFGVPAGSGVTRLVATHKGLAFVAFTNAASNVPLILARTGDTWNPLPLPLPPDPLSQGGVAYGMDVDDTDPDNAPILLVSTESKVWATNDVGATWSDVSNGLPRQPHCSDLRFNRFKRRWLLGTWGRSLWQAGQLVQVGVSSLIQSDFIAGAEHHNFEALVLIGEELFHYSKDNRDPHNRWTRTAKFPVQASGPACIIRSDFPEGGDHLNFEALVLEGRQLSHWFRANSVDQQWHFSEWVLDEATGSPAEVTGPASMVQSTYRADPDHSNFEALIPMRDGLWHWFRNSASGNWGKIVQVSKVPGSLGCITTSDYSNDADGNRALEALVFEPSQEPGLRHTGVLYHTFWKPDEGKWERTHPLTDQALGPAPVIQSDYIKGRPHHNLEALVWLLQGDRPILQLFTRHDDDGSLKWVGGDIISDSPQGPASLIQSDFRSDKDHGNLEAIFVELDNDLWHSFREASTMQWHSGGTVT